MPRVGVSLKARGACFAREGVVNGSQGLVLAEALLLVGAAARNRNGGRVERCARYDCTVGFARGDDVFSRARERAYARFADVGGRSLVYAPERLLRNAMWAWSVGGETMGASVGAIHLEMAKWAQMLQKGVNSPGESGKTVQMDETAANERKQSALSRGTRRRRLRRARSKVERV